MIAPTGTVTFLFTDIEGSTKLWEQDPEAMNEALARHDELLRQSVETNQGVVFKTVGDAFYAAFAKAPDALKAALAAQCALTAEPWPDDLQIRVRMALHTGTAEERDGDYFGPPLNRVARLLSAGHGGQTLLSLTVQDLIRDALPPQVTLKDWGERRLKDLGRPERVFQILHPDLPSEFPPLKSLDSPNMPNNLPQQVTTFIGREQEGAEVKNLLSQTHLLTLTGVGGTGKTRLSLQVAADLLDQFADGVWLVELAPVSDPSRVASTVAQVLNIAEEPGQPMEQTLARALKDKNLLLLLDNCEHVLGACATLANALMRACPQVKIIATSREGLGIAGEQVYRLRSLSLPNPKTVQTPESLSQYEAVRLFIDRAQMAQPSFTVTDENAPAVAAICHRLDGIPLAIELAAARVRAMSVELLMTRLDDRFRLLTGGSRTALPRQQTLRALIDWSYDLLTEPEKLLWCRLSVFSGGWTLEAAETIGAGEEIEDFEVLDLLTSLVDKSLVLYTNGPDGEGRYRLLEIVRQYGQDRLAESGMGSVIRERHAAYFVAFADKAEPMLMLPEQNQWLRVLEAEHDNMRAALAWYAEAQDPAGANAGLLMVSALWYFWRVRGYFSEARQHMNRALAHPLAQEHTRNRADALQGAGTLATDQSDFAVARVLHEESLMLNRELGNRHKIGTCLNNLAILARNQGKFSEARLLMEEALVIIREEGNKSSIAGALTTLGILAGSQDDAEGARALFQEVLDISRESGNKQRIASAAFNLAHMVKYQGDLAAAHALYVECLTLFWESGNKQGIAYSLAVFAIWHASRPALAARLWAADAALREAMNLPLPAHEQAENDVFLADVRKALGEEAFQAEWTIGHGMQLEEAVTQVLEAPADV